MSEGLFFWVRFPVEESPSLLVDWLVFWKLIWVGGNRSLISLWYAATYHPCVCLISASSLVYCLKVNHLSLVGVQERQFLGYICGKASE